MCRKPVEPARVELVITSGKVEGSFSPPILLSYYMTFHINRFIDTVLYSLIAQVSPLYAMFTPPHTIYQVTLTN